MEPDLWCVIISRVIVEVEPPEGRELYRLVAIRFPQRLSRVEATTRGVVGQGTTPGRRLLAQTYTARTEFVYTGRFSISDAENG